MVGSCGSPTDGDLARCRDLGVSSDLARVMYWGEVAPLEDRPNEGIPTSFIKMPLWYRDDAILVYTAAFFGGPMVRGVFEVSINPQTYEFVSVQPAHFPYPISSFDYVPPRQKLLVAYSTSPGNFEVALVSVEGPDLVIDSVIVDASRAPWSARADDSGRIVYYSGSAAPGFFQLGTDTSVDSLLWSTVLGPSEAFGFDIVADTLYFGQTIGASSSSRSAVLRDALGAGDPPVVIAELPGEFVSVRSDGQGHVLACTYVPGSSSTTPGSRVYLVDMKSGAASLLDTRTHPASCRAIIADFATWSPDGNAFAFSASSFSGEGDTWPRSLWVHKRPK